MKPKSISDSVKIKKIKQIVKAYENKELNEVSSLIAVKCALYPLSATKEDIRWAKEKIREHKGVFYLPDYKTTVHRTLS